MKTTRRKKKQKLQDKTQKNSHRSSFVCRNYPPKSSVCHKYHCNFSGFIKSIRMQFYLADIVISGKVSWNICRGFICCQYKLSIERLMNFVVLWTKLVCESSWSSLSIMSDQRGKVQGHFCSGNNDGNSVNFLIKDIKTDREAWREMRKIPTPKCPINWLMDSEKICSVFISNHHNESFYFLYQKCLFLHKSTRKIVKL